MRRHALFIGAFVILAAAHFVILLTSQTHVHSDEAIIGLMGKHILEGRYFPFYMYGQAYNAGAAWEAYLAAISFALFGVGVISLKSCIVVLSLLCLFLFYRMCLAFSSERLLVVFLVDPGSDNAVCIDRISTGSEAKDLAFLRPGVRRQHLVPRACDPAHRRIMDAVDFTPQAFAQ